MKRSILAAFAFAFFAWAVLASGSITKVSGRSRSQVVRPKDKAIHVNVALVLVNVAVVDTEDRLITTLQKDNFRLFEDDVEQEIAIFSHEDVPASVGIILDVSGSMSDKIDRTKQAALQILTAANPQDEFFLVTFGAQAKLRTSFTSDIEEVRSKMLLIQPGGSTPLLDAIYLGMKQMKNARYHRRALIVISDGGDNRSWHSESRIIKDLKEADCTLFAIGLFEQHDMKLTVEEHNGPTLLSKLVSPTGGRVFAVSHLNELPDVATKIGKELRDQYVLGYTPSGIGRPGHWRNIKVRVKPPAALPPVHVYAKSGYYAPPD